MAASSGKVEVSSLWTDSGGERGDGAESHGDHLQGGRFLVDVARKKAPLAVAAPGLQ
jgi:hypothetical protein